jgi:hypothetical protein
VQHIQDCDRHHGPLRQRAGTAGTSARLTLIADTSDAALIISDKDSRILHVNRGFSSVWLAERRSAGKTPSACWHRTCRPNFQKATTAHCVPGRPWSGKKLWSAKAVSATGPRSSATPSRMRRVPGHTLSHAHGHHPLQDARSVCSTGNPGGLARERH